MSDTTETNNISQTNQQDAELFAKPTVLEMAQKAMEDMKRRIDLVRSHRSNVNRLIQVASNTVRNPPLFLIQETEAEEALLRRTRTELNLWIQHLTSGKPYTAPEIPQVVRADVDPVEAVCARRQGRDEIEGAQPATLQIAEDWETAYDEAYALADHARWHDATGDCDECEWGDTYLDFREFIRDEFSHQYPRYAEDYPEMAEHDALWLWENSTLEPFQKWDVLVGLYRNTECDGSYCFGEPCYSYSTKVPNI